MLRRGIVDQVNWELSNLRHHLAASLCQVAPLTFPPHPHLAAPLSQALGCPRPQLAESLHRVRQEV